MPKQKNQYILSAQEETQRLDRQARMKAFDFEEELRFLEVKEGQRILDAGCGSGIVSEYLSQLATAVEVVGCDHTRERVDAAKAKYGTTNNLRFEQWNLLDLDQIADRFDIIVCRYVLRHFNQSDGHKVISNLLSTLNPGGTLYCVDVEGVMGDIHFASPFVRDILRKIRESSAVNFQIARTLPTLLSDHGCNDVQWHMLVSEFKGDDLKQEIQNLEQSLINADAFLKQLAGGSKEAEDFKAQYLSILSGTKPFVHAYNRVIARGTKPRSPLKLVSNADS